MLFRYFCASLRNFFKILHDDAPARRCLLAPSAFAPSVTRAMHIHALFLQFE